MAQISIQLLEDIKSDLRRLQKAGHGWHKIGLVLFNRDGSYAAKVLGDSIIPSQAALHFYEIWKAHDEGGRQEASPELRAAVWHYLRAGREYSTTSREMADYFLIDPRKIRRACADLRDRGFLVGSGQAGYYKIVQPYEKAETIAHLMSREREIRKRRIALSKMRLTDWRTNAVVVAEGVAQLQLGVAI